MKIKKKVACVAKERKKKQGEKEREGGKEREAGKEGTINTGPK